MQSSLPISVGVIVRDIGGNFVAIKLLSTSPNSNSAFYLFIRETCDFPAPSPLNISAEIVLRGFLIIISGKLRPQGKRVEFCMGTIVLGLRSDQTKKDPIIYFRQYLGSRRNPKIPRKVAKELGHRSKEYKHTKAGYLIHIFGWVGDMFISIHSGKRYANPHMPDHLLTFHLSQTGKIRIATKILIRAIGYDVAKDFLLKGEARRVDAYLDISACFEDMRSSIHRPYVHADKDFDNFLRSIYYGKSEPLYAILYEKLIEATSSIDFSIGRVGDPKIFCRLEGRMFKEEVPIETFADYHLLAEVNPFAFLKVRFLPSEEIDSLLQQEHLTAKRFSFLRSILRNSLQFAIKRFSKSRDFYNDLGPFLNQIAEPMDLHPHWKRKVNKLVDGFDVRKYFEEKDNLRSKNHFTLESLRTEYGDYRYSMLGFPMEAAYANL